MKVFTIFSAVMLLFAAGAMAAPEEISANSADNVDEKQFRPYPTWRNGFNYYRYGNYWLPPNAYTRLPGGRIRVTQGYFDQGRRWVPFVGIL
ncbi:hypothetical protein BY996DRAFT_6816796 [Phakopsora pachyrhizi]|uniref:Secreted protein n=1 Tax=Phakopsora pachyrhizi TaxID=170000 RepID=A0A0S1MIR0_PHAPC|nr:hypothetical protein BY996DRAFT_6816796 [Phakopsora pachyrhizi]